MYILVLAWLFLNDTHRKDPSATKRKELNGHRKDGIVNKRWLLHLNSGRVQAKKVIIKSKPLTLNPKPLNRKSLKYLPRTPDGGEGEL